MISLTLINTVFSIFKVITKKQVVAKKPPSKISSPPLNPPLLLSFCFSSLLEFELHQNLKTFESLI